MNQVYLYVKDIEAEELSRELDALRLPFQFMIAEHFDTVEPSLYTPELIRPEWLNRARFFGPNFELRCRRKGKRLWTVLTSEPPLPKGVGDEEKIAYHTDRLRTINLWGKLLDRPAEDGMPRWYEERLMRPIAYPMLCVAELVDLWIKEYLDQEGTVVAHRFVGFLPRQRSKSKEQGEGR